MVIEMKMIIFLALIAAQLLLKQAYAETEDYLSALHSSDYKTRLDALKSLESLPTDDVETYNFINMNLMNGYMAGGDGNQIEEIAWMCKTLAASGLEQYEHSLVKIVENTNNSKIKRHCANSLAALKTNKEALQQLNGEPIAGFSPEMSKYIRMIKSGNSSWMKNAVLKIQNSSERNEQVLDMVRDVLLSEVARIGGDDSQLSDAHRFKRMYEIGNLGHFCLCLGASGMNKYKADLQKVIDSTKNVSLKNYARKAMEALP